MPVSVIWPPAVVSVWQASNTLNLTIIFIHSFLFSFGQFLLLFDIDVKAYRVRISGGFNPRKHTRGVNTPQ